MVITIHLLGGRCRFIELTDTRKSSCGGRRTIIFERPPNRIAIEIMSSTGTSLWRVAGMSYLQYVNKSAGILREALKEPVKSKLTPRTNVEFAGFKWADGERGKRGK